MKSLLIIMMIVTGLAYLSQKESMKYQRTDGRKHWDIYLILLIIFLVLFAGLRTSYNDTSNYIQGYINSDNIRQFLSNKENLDILHNPLFYGFQALIRTRTTNANVFLMLCAIIVNILNVRFIKRNVDVDNFALSMFLYVTLGTLLVSIAAQKQILAMSILTLAIPHLFDKRYVRYFIIVFIAGLIHTYAWLFFFLPLLKAKPWSFQTFLLLGATFVIMTSFQGILTTMLEVADEVGKNVSADEVFDGNQMSIFRVLVYSIVPFTALIFKNRLSMEYDEKTQVFMQMSIMSLVFMLMGTMDGANMFGRMANYFEFGYICILPWLIKQLFNKQSVTILSILLIVCFNVFYLHDNQGFNYEYRHKTIIQFVREVI